MSYSIHTSKCCSLNENDGKTIWMEYSRKKSIDQWHLRSYRWAEMYIFFTNKQFMLCKIHLTDFYFIKNEYIFKEQIFTYILTAMILKSCQVVCTYWMSIYCRLFHLFFEGRCQSYRPEIHTNQMFETSRRW